MTGAGGGHPPQIVSIAGTKGAMGAAYKYDADKRELTLHLCVYVAPALRLQELLGLDIRRALAEDRRALAPTYPTPK